MSHSEQAITFDCAGETLVGVVGGPHDAGPAGVLIVVGGPQYRAGSHRQFVQLTRALAAAGIPALRFDVRGMGDSRGAQRSFEDIDADIAAAADALQRHRPGVHRVLLWGLCDGASAALLYLQRTRDPRIGGLALLNPWVRSEASLARTQVRHYYAERMRQREFWRKLLAGRIGLSALVDWARAAGQARCGAGIREGASTFQERMAEAWKRFDVPILLVLSGRDFTAQEFLDAVAVEPCWRGAFERPDLRVERLADADHTFSDSASRAAVERLTVGWALPTGSAQPFTMVNAEFCP